jgi:ketosteroid isomerase-like protein
MSQENVEIVRRAFEFFERGEVPFALADPENRIDNIPESPIPGPYYGHVGLRHWWEDIVDALPGFRLEIEEAIDVGDDRVVAVVRTFGHEVMEQMPSTHWAIVHWVRNGLIVRTAGYLRKEEALEAVGLSEQDAHADS